MPTVICSFTRTMLRIGTIFNNAEILSAAKNAPVYRFLAIRVQSAAISSSKQYAVLSRHSDTEYQTSILRMLKIVQNAYLV